MAAKLFNFVEQPLFLTAAGFIGGIIGTLIYLPILAVSGFCILLAFHRAKVVEGWSTRAQVSFYIAASILTAIALSVTAVAIRRNIPHPVTARDLADQLVPLLGRSEPSTQSQNNGQTAPQKKTESTPIEERVVPAEPGIHMAPATPSDFPVQPPERVQLLSGGNTFVTRSSRLRDGLMVEDLLGGDCTDEETPVSVWFAPDGYLQVNAELRDLSTNVAFVAKDSKYRVLNRTWDLNNDRDVVEVVNENKIVVFRVERLNWDTIKLSGIFIKSRERIHLIVTPNGVHCVPFDAVRRVWIGQIDPLEKQPRILPMKPLFKYPSSQFRGVRIKSVSR